MPTKSTRKKNSVARKPRRNRIHRASVQYAVPRRGLLPLTTTRGDRLFIGLLGAAYIHLAWVGLASGSLWYGFAIAVVWMIAVMRFG